MGLGYVRYAPEKKTQEGLGSHGMEQNGMVLIIAAPNQPMPGSAWPFVRQYDSRSEAPKGDEEDYGDSVVEDEQDFDCVPDETDLEEGIGPAQIAAKYIREHALSEGIEPSSSGWTPGDWYSSSEMDISTGDMLERSFHPNGFTPEQEQEIYRLVTRKWDPSRVPGGIPSPSAPEVSDPFEKIAPEDLESLGTI